MIVTWYGVVLALAVIVPEISPVLELMDSPLGNPDAEYVSVHRDYPIRSPTETHNRR